MNKKEINQKILEIMNKNQFYSLSSEEISLFKKYVEKCDLNIKSIYKLTPLLFVFKNNKILKLEKRQVNYLIEHSDLKQQDQDGSTFLKYASRYNKHHNLNLTENHWNYILEKNELTKNTYEQLDWNPIVYILQFKEENSLNIRENQIKKIIISLNKKQQKEIFKNLIIYNSDKITQDDFIKKMNFLLYDCNIFRVFGFGCV
jgi:hypothetical protein